MADLMGRNEYARHRKCAPNAVKKAEDDGRIKAAVQRDESGKFQGIDWRLADKLWAMNTDPVEAARNGKFNQPGSDLLGEQSIPPATESAAGSPADAAAGPASSGASEPRGDPAGTANAGGVPPVSDQSEYLAARAKREGYMAETARLDHLERLGLLVSTADVEHEMAEIFGQVKASVMRIADRKAQILAAESDPGRVHRILNEEFRTAFDECSRRFAAIAAHGAEEPAPALQ